MRQTPSKSDQVKLELSLEGRRPEADRLPLTLTREDSVIYPHLK